MQISERTLIAMRKAICEAITGRRDVAVAALKGFAESASLNDWDALEEQKEPA